MPHHKQFKKDIKVSEKARVRNHAMKSRVANVIKKVRAAESKEEAQELFKTAASIIDSTSRKGVIKKETAARKKSRLSKFISTLK